MECPLYQSLFSLCLNFLIIKQFFKKDYQLLCEKRHDQKWKQCIKYEAAKVVQLRDSGGEKTFKIYNWEVKWLGLRNGLDVE